MIRMMGNVSRIFVEHSSDQIGHHFFFQCCLPFNRRLLQLCSYLHTLLLRILVDCTSPLPPLGGRLTVRTNVQTTLVNQSQNRLIG